jgi:hypothetical protein
VVSISGVFISMDIYEKANRSENAKKLCPFIFLEAVGTILQIILVLVL